MLRTSLTEEDRLGLLHDRRQQRNESPFAERYLLRNTTCRALTTRRHHPFPSQISPHIPLLRIVDHERNSSYKDRPFIIFGQPTPTGSHVARIEKLKGDMPENVVPETILGLSCCCDYTPSPAACGANDEFIYSSLFLK